MPKLNPDIEAFARIKVIGVGGSGGNAVNHMIESKFNAVEYICVNTDTQDLHFSLATHKIHLGKNLTKGLGSGMNPDVGRQAAEETKAEIQEAIKGADMVFISCGMGGGTGTGASPVIARIAKEQNILTVAIVTKPFSFEGEQRGKIAEQGVEDLSKEVDAIIVIPNDNLINASTKETSFKDAFAMSDEVLRQSVEGISELITTPGIINIDFADIKTILTDAGSTFMGIGIATGENRAEEAAMKAINSPLIDISISGAKGVLFAITGNEDIMMHEIQDVAKIITESISKDAKVIFGSIRDDSMKKGEIKVTVIATGFSPSEQKKSLFGKKDTFEDRGSVKSSTHTRPVVRKQEEPSEDSFVEEIETVDDFNGDEDDDNWSAVPAFLRRRK